MNVPGSAQILCRWQKRSSGLLASIAHTKRCDYVTFPAPCSFLSLAKPGLCLHPILKHISVLRGRQFWICQLFPLLTVCEQLCPVATQTAEQWRRTGEGGDTEKSGAAVFQLGQLLVSVDIWQVKRSSG